MQSNCILCGGQDFDVVMSGPDRVLGLPGTYTVVRCRSCGLARTEPQIPVEDRAKYYEPEEKPEPGKDARIVFYQGRLAARIDKAVAGRNSRSIDCGDSPPSVPPCQGGKKRGSPPYQGGAGGGRLSTNNALRRVLDIGCGEGVFLDLMRSLGWETMGVELGEESSRIAREKGLNVITGDMFSRDIENGAFDAVVMSHVLEHLDDPVAALERVRDLLKPGGVLMLSLPNYRCMEAKLFKEDWYCWMLPPHLYHFDVRSVRMAIEKAGLKTKRVSYLPFFFLIQSIRYALKRTDGPGNPFPAPGSGEIHSPTSLSHSTGLLADQISGERPSGDRFPGRSKDTAKTAIFKSILTISSLAGRFMPGEIMEVMARKPAPKQ